MERFLLFIKHHLAPVWKIIDWVNSFIYSILFANKQKTVVKQVLKETPDVRFHFRELTKDDMPLLYALINNQLTDDLIFFKPHGFSLKALESQYRKSSFLMMGAFHEDALVGYFFLRFFFNRKCFVGRLIDKNYRGKGIGREMNRIMYETAWRMKFRCLSTISKNNRSVMMAHSQNETMKVLRSLKNDYLLVEFVNKRIND